jgi:hypothetical protein
MMKKCPHPLTEAWATKAGANEIRYIFIDIFEVGIEKKVPLQT